MHGEDKNVSRVDEGGGRTAGKGVPKAALSYRQAVPAPGKYRVRAANILAPSLHLRLRGGTEQTSPQCPASTGLDTASRGRGRMFPPEAVAGADALTPGFNALWNRSHSRNPKLYRYVYNMVYELI